MDRQLLAALWHWLLVIFSPFLPAAAAAAAQHAARRAGGLFGAFRLTVLVRALVFQGRRRSGTLRLGLQMGLGMLIIISLQG